MYKKAQDKPLEKTPSGCTKIPKYIHGESREQMRIESYVEEDREVRVIDKLIDIMDIESLGFKVGNNEFVERPKFDPRDLLKLYIYGYLRKIVI